MLVKNYYGEVVLRIEGDRCYDTNNSWIYALKGNQMYNSSGELRFEVRGERVYDTQGNWVYQIFQDKPPSYVPESVLPKSPVYEPSPMPPQQPGYAPTPSHHQNFNPYANTATQNKHPAVLFLQKNWVPVLAIVVAVIIVIGIGIMLLTGGDNGTGHATGDAYDSQYGVGHAYNSAYYTNDTPATQYEPIIIPYEPTTRDGSLTFGDTFQFNGTDGPIEITFGTEVYWGRIGDNWSVHYNAPVFAIPITIRNLSSGTGGLSTYDFNQFAPSGLILEFAVTLSSCSIAMGLNSMRAGASQTSLLNFLYDEDGEYVIQFGVLFGDSIEARFQIAYTGIPSTEEFDRNLFPPSTFMPLAADGMYTFGDTFRFAGSSGEMEVALGTDISWMEVNNIMSQNDGASVFAVPVSVTNIGEEAGSLNFIEISLFGSDGLRLPPVGAYFGNDVMLASPMSPGDTMEGYVFFLYVGSGQYAIEFSAGFGIGEFIEVVLYITR